MLLFFTITIACQEKPVENAEWLASKKLLGLLNYIGMFFLGYIFPKTLLQVKENKLSHPRVFLKLTEFSK